ncbi:MAG: penicillin-binding protein 2 [Gammaproteobacteria bacterium]|nr:penicillin-binding protein 2 [Gammaproteobacteria bacterium]
MAERITIRDHFRDSHIFTNRAVLAIIFISLLLIGLVTRLIYLQVIGHEHYTTLSDKNRVNRISIPPIRGMIFDRNGVVMAKNVPTFSLELIPERIPNLKQTLNEIQQLVTITDADIKRFNKEVRKRKRFNNIPLRFRLNEEEVAKLAVNLHRFQGVEIASRLSRNYPLGPLAVHVLGYVGRISERDLQTIDTSNYRGSTHIGKTGIERTYEDTLHGRIGYQDIEANAVGRTLRVLERTSPKTGSNLYLNIDSALQRVAEKALGTENGALVAIDVETGGILSMVSMPTYDPNLFINGIDSDSYNTLSKSTTQPLFNRAIQGQYPPGSTVKPFVGMAGLETGHAQPGKPIFCAGWYLSEGEHKRRYRDWKRDGHGLTSLSKAITESCDVYFYDLAYNMGIDDLSVFMQQFGFGSRTGIDMLGEMPGLIPTREWKKKIHNVRWFPGETILTGIGQGYSLTTPLQLASATATLANGGRRIQPRLVGIIEDANNGEQELLQPKLQHQIALSETHNWAYIKEAMVNVVHGSTGSARGSGWGLKYKMAGKTGTAQVFGIKEDEVYNAEELEKRLRDHALFIAYAPAEKPRIAVAVIVENGGGGGSVAAPIARKVIDHYMVNP